MTQRRLLFALLILTFALAGCDPADDDDAGAPPSDAGGSDAGGGAMDGGGGAMDAGGGAMDAGGGMVDAGGDVDAASIADAAADASACISLDGGDAATHPDGSVFCPSAPPLAACPSATPATDVTLTMITTTPGGGATTDVRARHYLDTGMLTEQRTRETMTPGGGAMTDLLRIWTATSPTNQATYAIRPPTPHPTTLEPKARQGELMTTGVLDALATFPTYAREMLACLADADVIGCIDDRGTFTDLGTTDTSGAPCREMRWADGTATVCVPAACDARRTLYPYWVQGPSGIRVDFESLAPATLDDVVFFEPSPCESIGAGIVLCDHPDL